MSEQTKEMTESEQLEAGRVMLSAALSALGDFPSDPKEEDEGDMARRVVIALAAAGKARKSECERFKNYVEAQPHHVVATAFWMWSEKVQLDITDVQPCCIAGVRYLGFAQGMAAARAMNEALDMITNVQEFSFDSSGAEALLPTIKTLE